MPVPMMNVINGGAHANNSLDLQEFMIIPWAPHLPRSPALGCRGVPRAEEDPHDKGHQHRRGRRRRLCPSVESHEAAIQLILQAIEARATPPATRSPGPGLRRQRVLQGRHVRAAEGEGGLKLTAQQWTDMLASW